MNPQPHPFVGQIGVLIFGLMVTYFMLTNKNKKITFNDQYEIGYIYDTPIQIVKKQTVAVSAPKTKTVKVKPQAKQPQKQKVQAPQKEQKPAINQELFNDCVLVLVSLGSKKSEAKTTAKNIFEKHNPQTIEDFIKFVCIK